MTDSTGLARRGLLLALSAALWLAGCSGAGQPPATAVPKPAASAAPTAAASSPGAASSPAGAAAAPGAGVTPVAASVKAGSIFALTDSPMILALERGYFQEVGINLDVQQFQSIVNMIPLLSTNQLDVAFDGASSAGFFNAIGRGIDIKMVANQGIAQGSSDERPYYAIVASKQLADAGRVRRVGDLRGLPVNVLAEGSLAQLLVGLALAQDGLTLADVDQQQLAMPDTLAGLQNGSIAGSFFLEPFITLGRQQGTVEVLVNAERLAPGREITDVFYASGFAQNRPVGNNFVVAYLRGVRDYLRIFFENQDDRATAVAQLVKHLAVKEPALYERMGLPYFNPDGHINTADIRAQQDWYVSQGQVQQPIDVDRVVDNSYADYALSILGPYRP
ncbi:MAG TPA: ABC transporter substrate-binding protein [Chloroflexota bacterium]|nr:ABC transporter substrate-binding protein [Chloroflexota bacterium]